MNIFFSVYCYIYRLQVNYYHLIEFVSHNIWIATKFDPSNGNIEHGILLLSKC